MYIRKYVGCVLLCTTFLLQTTFPPVELPDHFCRVRRAEIEQMKGSPFTRERDGKVRDRSGKVIDLFPGVREALLEVHRGGRFAGTQLAIASRTPEIR